MKTITDEQKVLLQAFVVSFMDNTRDRMVELLTRWKRSGRLLSTVSPVEVLENIEEAHPYPITLATAIYTVLPAMIGKFLAAHIRVDITIMVGQLIDEVDGMVE